MKIFHNKRLDLAYWFYRTLVPDGDVTNFYKNGIRYINFFRDMQKYSKMKNAEPIKIAYLYPCLNDKTKNTPFDSHYFYQDVWCARRIAESKVQSHVDVGSTHHFVGFLTSITNVTFIDIRPLNINLKNFESLAIEHIRTIKQYDYE